MNKKPESAAEFKKFIMELLNSTLFKKQPGILTDCFQGNEERMGNQFTSYIGLKAFKVTIKDVTENAMEDDAVYDPKIYLDKK